MEIRIETGLSVFSLGLWVGFKIAKFCIFMSPDQVAAIASFFDRFDPPQRSRKLDNKTAFECLLYVLQTGVSWKHAPAVGCSSSAVYKRLRHWVKHGVIKSVWHHLYSHYKSERLQADPGWFKTVFIDSTMIKNLAGVDVVGPNPTDRGRLGSKISVICDDARVPLGCVLYPANKHDCLTVEATFESIASPLLTDRRRTIHVCGDKAYGTKAIGAFLTSKSMRQVVESKRNARAPRRLTKGDKEKLRRRHKIENFFCRLKQFKRIRHRMDALAVVYEAQVLLAFCSIIMPQIQKMQDLPVIPCP